MLVFTKTSACNSEVLYVIEVINNNHSVIVLCFSLLWGAGYFNLIIIYLLILEFLETLLMEQLVFTVCWIRLLWLLNAYRREHLFSYLCNSGGKSNWVYILHEIH